MKVVYFLTLSGSVFGVEKFGVEVENEIQPLESHWTKTAIKGSDNNCLFVFARNERGENKYHEADSQTLCISEFPRRNRFLYRWGAFSAQDPPTVSATEDVLKIDCKDGNKYFAKINSKFDPLELAIPYFKSPRVAITVHQLGEEVGGENPLFIRKDAVLWTCDRLRYEAFRTSKLDNSEKVNASRPQLLETTGIWLDQEDLIPKTAPPDGETFSNLIEKVYRDAILLERSIEEATNVDEVTRKLGQYLNGVGTSNNQDLDQELANL